MKSKRERFEKESVRRTNVALKAIERVGRCGNRASYEYWDIEREAIFDALTEATLKARAKFDPPANKIAREPDLFSLPALAGFQGEG